MSISPFRVVGVAGFAESETLIRDAAQHASEILNIDNDAEAFTLDEALKKPDELEKAVYRSVLLLHSAASIAVTDRIDPVSYISWAGSEPQSRTKLIFNATKKTLSHASKPMFGTNYIARDGLGSPASINYSRGSVSRVLLEETKELSRYSTRRTLELLSTISLASSLEIATDFKNANPKTETVYVEQQHDEFGFEPSLGALMRSGHIPFRSVAGSHDEIYLNAHIMDGELKRLKL